MKRIIANKCGYPFYLFKPYRFYWSDIINHKSWQPQTQQYHSNKTNINNANNCPVKINGYFTDVISFLRQFDDFEIIL